MVYLHLGIKIFNFSNVDYFFKISCNDGFLHYYSYYWLSFLFLFLFFFCFLLITQNNSFFFLFFFVFYLYYCYEICNNYFSLNKLLSFSNIFWYEPNMLLTNNLNKYHPFLFYLNLLLFYFGFAKIYKIKALYAFFYKNQEILELKQIVVNNFYVSYLVLFLGAWWAFQEGTWGGWWNWDPSELFGVGFLFSFLLLLHQLNYTFNISFQSLNFINYFLIMFVWYYFIQINFELTSHNFGLRFFYFFNNNFFYIELLFSVIFLFFLKTKTCVFLINNFTLLFHCYKNFFVVFNFYYHRYTFVMLSLSYFFLTHHSLLNYFLWKLFGFNFLFFSVNFNFFNFFLFFLFYYFCMRLGSYISVLIFFWTCINNAQLVIILYFYKKNRFFYIVHFLILNFIFVNLLNLNLNLFIFEFVNLFSNDGNKHYHFSYVFDFFLTEIVFVTSKVFFFCSWKYLFNPNLFSYFLTNNTFSTQLVINLQNNAQFFLFFEPYLSVILIISFFISNQLIFYNFWIHKSKSLLQF